MKPVIEYATMVARVESKIAGFGVGYTPAIRRVEALSDEVGRRLDRGEATREEYSRAVERAEEEWLVGLARAKRLGGKR